MDTTKSLPEYEKKARELAEITPEGFYINQYENPANSMIHYETTGPEIWRGTKGKVNAFVVGNRDCWYYNWNKKVTQRANPAIKVLFPNSLVSFLQGTV